MGLDVSLASPGTKACDSVGGAIRPQWRETPVGRRGEQDPSRSFPLDSLGEQIYIPRSSRRDFFRAQATGHSARYAGHVDLEGRFPWTLARLRHSAAHPADFERSSRDSAGLALSRAVSPGTSGLDHQWVGRVGKQSKGEVLPPHRGRKAQAEKRSQKVEPHGRGHRWTPAHDTRGSMTLLSRFRSWLRAIVRRSRMENEMDTELRFRFEGLLVRRRSGWRGNF